MKLKIILSVILFVSFQVDDASAMSLFKRPVSDYDGATSDDSGSGGSGSTRTSYAEENDPSSSATQAFRAVLSPRNNNSEMGGGSRGGQVANGGEIPKSVNVAGYKCALSQAQAYLRQNAGRKGLANSYITLVDLDAPTNTQRMVIVNARTGSIVERHTVSNAKGGINSSAGQHGSELGFMKVSETYSGKHGLSGRLDGLEPGNRDTRSRAVVIHGASYVTEGGNAGRSWGCFAVDNRSVAKVLNRLKGGTLLYSYRSSNVCHRGS